MTTSNNAILFKLLFIMFVSFSERMKWIESGYSIGLAVSRPVLQPTLYHFADS